MSDSWFSSLDSSIQQSIDAMAAAGQSVFVLSGDGGGMVLTPSDIRNANHVTLVGATTLSTFGTPTTPPTETVMVVATSGATVSSGGGYFGSYLFFGGEGIPSSYQTSNFITSQNLASGQWRNSPDVSMFGAFMELVFTNGSGTQGQITGFGGTSVSTPLFAGFTALANQKAVTAGVATVGFANPVLYAIGSGALYDSCFNDITSGSNTPEPGSNGAGPLSPLELADGLPTNGFPAVTGYDLATGLGTPTCTLLTQLASPTPTVPVPPPTPPSSTPPSLVGIGPSDTCGVVSGATECWGANSSGEDGNGNTSQQESPVCGIESASLGAAVDSVAVGSGHACAVFQEDGDVWCWGANNAGQLGPLAVDTNGNTLSMSDTAVSMQGVPPAGDIVVQISAGGDTTCALMGGETVWCWGANDQGQLGINSTNGGPNPNPTEVQGLPPAAQVAVSPSGTFVCALLQSGGVDCWGATSRAI